jgi:hypothetical protein
VCIGVTPNGRSGQALQFRIATRQEIPETVQVFNESFRTPTDEKTWEWYAYGNPFGETQVYLAIDDRPDTPVGAFVFTPVPLSLGKRSIPASSGHHLCLKAAFQGGSAFIGMSRAALQGEVNRGMRLGLGLPNRKSHVPQKALLKWVDLCFLDCLYKAPGTARAHGCREIKLFPPQFDTFYGRVTQDLDFYIHKNAAWMNWRFLERPGSPYTVFAVERGSELAGYVVLKRWREADGYTKAHIIDLHALDTGALMELVASAESYASDCQEINLWAAPGYPYLGFLEDTGFEPRQSARQPLIAKVLSGEAIPLQCGRAAFSYADGDFVY